MAGAFAGAGLWRSVAEAGGGEGTFCPSVFDIGKVPVDCVGGGVSVQLVADVDEGLGSGNIDVVDGRKI